MPLNPTILANALIDLDADGGPKSINDAADRWTKAWWKYAGQMNYLNPASLQGSEQLAKAAFQPALLPAFAPIPVPLAFFTGLELAMRAGWTALSTPVALQTPAVALTPAPVPFAPIGVTVVPTGLATSDKKVVRTQLALDIHIWTITIVAASSGGPIGPIF